MFGNGSQHGGRLARSLLAAAIVATLAGGLVGCGGGGSGNLKSGTPTSPPPPPPPTSPPPPPPPPPPLVQPAIDAHLSVIHATAAERQGYTGAGYRIGIIDSGVNRDHPTLAGRVAANLTYVSSNGNNLSVDDVVGHGTTVAQLAAGAAVDRWPGGVAPGAGILSARIISDKEPDDDGSGQGNEVTGAIGIKGINQDLASRGMRIMNNSWGGLYWTQASATAAIADEYRFFIRDYDGLVVFATGNEGFDDPSDMAALPSQPGSNGTSPAADLEQGWLAVTALDTSAPDTLADYANACGVARNYCLAAPGTAVFIGADSTASNLEYYYGAGTSYAAPLVSGAAALVWEKYPYFNNDLVRQTLLGTATDLGDTGVDAVFGHGRLDVAKALGGPAKFDWGDVTVDFTGSSTWSNPVSGNGGLVKQGTGTLAIGDGGDALDYQGATRVRGGTLEIRGVLSASDVSVEAGGRLAGTRTLGGDLSNAGVVEIGAAQAGGSGLTVAGDYVQKDGSQLALTLGYGALEVQGKATIEGGDVHVLGVRDGYVTQAREDVISATGGLNGRFDGLTSASGVFLDASLLYTNTEAWLDVRRLDITATARGLSGISAASVGAAQRVEAAFDQIDAQQAGGGSGIADGFIRIAGQFQRTADPASAAASLESLSGQAHAAATSATFDSLDLGRRALAGRFDQVASGQAQAGGWAQALGGAGSQQAGLATRVDGWMIGQDLLSDGATVAGLAFGESLADGRAEGLADRSRERQTSAQAYLGTRAGNGYVLGQFGAGQWQRQLDRELLVGGARHGVHSDYDGNFASAGVEAGWRLQGAAGALVPYLGAEYARVRSDGFHEAGAEGFGLRSHASDASRSQAIAGLRAEHGWGRVQVRGYAEWQQTLSSDGLDFQASFVGADAWSPLAGTDPARSGGLFGLSAVARLSANADLALAWDQRFGPRGDASLVSLRYAFGF